MSAEENQTFSRNYYDEGWNNKGRILQFPEIDSKAPYSVSQATEEDMRWIACHNQLVYPESSDVIPAELIFDRFNTNPTGFSIIKDRNGNRFGDIELLPLKLDTLRRILGDGLTENEIREVSLFAPNESSKIDTLYVSGFTASGPWDLYRCLMSAPELVKRICDPSQIKAVYSIKGTEEGIHLMKNLGFKELGNKRKNRYHLFYISFPDLIKNIATLVKDDENRNKFSAFLKELE